MPPIRKQNVGGTPDFHSVLLEWDFASEEDATGAEPSFAVRFCENQVSLHTRLTEIGKSRCSRLRECCRQAEAEGISKCSNKIHQTLCTDFSHSLYNPNATVNLLTVPEHLVNAPMMMIEGEGDREMIERWLRGIYLTDKVLVVV